MHCEIIHRYFNIFFVETSLKKKTWKVLFGRQGLGAQTGIPVSQTAWIHWVLFNYSWFVFHDFSWSFQELYFSRKHKFHESHWLTRTNKTMVFKPVNKYQITQQCNYFKNILISDFQHHQFLYRAENKFKRRDNEPFKHLFNIWLFWCQYATQAKLVCLY